MCFYYHCGLYLLHGNFNKQEVLKQFRIFNGWNTRFLNAKFLKADDGKRKFAKSAGNKNHSLKYCLYFTPNPKGSYRQYFKMYSIWFFPSGDLVG